MKNLSNRNFTKVIVLLTILLIIFLSGCDERQKESESFSFIFMGDCQADPETGDYSKWGELLAMAAENEKEPSFILLGGDLVNDGSDQNEWDSFLKAGGDTLAHLKIYPAMGNHDNTELFKEQFDLPQNGPEGKKGEFYSFDYENTHFVILDSNAMGAANEEDIKWLENDLKFTDKAHKIAMFHHPAYTAVDNPKDENRAQTIKENFVPVLEEYGVSLVLSGHQHVYMRTYPMKGDVFCADGITYLMGVSGGKQYTPAGRDYYAFSQGKEPVYSICTVSEAGISVETYNNQGEVIDSFNTWEEFNVDLSDEQLALKLVVVSDEGEKVFNVDELGLISNIGFQGMYSTVNNWPSSSLYGAKGLRLRKILEEANVYQEAESITFASSDGYEMSFTKEQLFGKTRWCYPLIKENKAKNPMPVEPILAYAFKEGVEDLAEFDDLDAKPLCLIFGQKYIGEFTNPAFVEDVWKIIISTAEPETWEVPSTFPLEGVIAKGETVKLQHPKLGLVKIYYTLDGTEPTEESNVYNPSTYQPELNKPIPIEDNTTIKAMAVGFGKRNSQIATFTFTVSDR